MNDHENEGFRKKTGEKDFEVKAVKKSDRRADLSGWPLLEQLTGEQTGQPVGVASRSALDSVHAARHTARGEDAAEGAPPPRFRGLLNPAARSRPAPPPNATVGTPLKPLLRRVARGESRADRL